MSESLTEIAGTLIYTRQIVLTSIKIFIQLMPPENKREWNKLELIHLEMLKSLKYQLDDILIIDT